MESVNPAETTFWENMATRRWGRYLTSVENQAIQTALRRFTEPGDAVEIGCEGGRWSRMLADHGWRVVCTDVCPDALATCQQRIPDAECYLVDPHDQKFPVASESCDLLLAIEVPINGEPWFAPEVSRVLRPGGVAVCTFQNRDSYRGRLVNLRSHFRRRPVHYKAGYREGSIWVSGRSRGFRCANP